MHCNVYSICMCIQFCFRLYTLMHTHYYNLMTNDWLYQSSLSIELTYNKQLRMTKFFYIALKNL